MNDSRGGEAGGGEGGGGGEGRHRDELRQGGSVQAVRMSRLPGPGTTWWEG